MRTYRFTDEALGELIAVADYINRRRDGYGDRFVKRLHNLADRLCESPQQFAKLPNAPRGCEARRGKVHKYPFIIDYQVTDAEVILLAITHGHRRRTPWRRRLN